MKQGRHKTIGKGWVCGKLDRTSPIEGAIASQQTVSPVFARLFPFFFFFFLAFSILKEKLETRTSCVCTDILVYTKSLFLNGGN